MKRKLLVAVPLLCVVALLAWLFRPKHESLGEAYVGERSHMLILPLPCYSLPLRD